MSIEKGPKFENNNEQETLGERGEKYRNSPEGQRAVVEEEERRKEFQKKADALVKQLPNLDFNNQEAVLDWICEFQAPSNHTGVDKYYSEKVLEVFAEHGYFPGMNLGKAFNEDDPDNFAHFIVGDALSGIQFPNGIHQVVHKYTKKWKEKFAS